MDLLDHIIGKYETLSIIGMSKNSGKTVALNEILSQADLKEVSIGVTSIGRDGEQIDIVTETEKPKIYLTAGSLVATTTKLLELSEVVVEIIKLTDFETPLGNVIVGRVKYDGYVQISGPQTLKETKVLVDMMRDLGAQIVIVDGAIDRKTSAAPEITQCTILASGASVNRNMNTVVEKTKHIASLFDLPLSTEFREQIHKILDKDGYGIVDHDGNIREIPLATSLNAGRKLASEITEETRYLVLSGALTKSTLEDIIKGTKYYRDITIVISDGTKLFVDYKEFQKFLRRGVHLEVFHNSKLIAVTVNPYATEGYRFDPFRFKEAMEDSLPGIAVYDVMMGGRE
ncbi:MAG: hypothetical protein Q4Q07_06060 [Tissierellia bacterium]|nr:hypothetical protein [Tissierellia bacterium]